MEKKGSSARMKMTAAPSSIYEATKLAGEMLRRLLNNEASVGEAKAACGLINCMQAGLHLRQEQARLAGLKMNGDVLPDVHFDPNAEPSQRSVALPEPKKRLVAAK